MNFLLNTRNRKWKVQLFCNKDHGTHFIKCEGESRGEGEGSSPIAYSLCRKGERLAFYSEEPVYLWKMSQYYEVLDWISCLFPLFSMYLQDKIFFQANAVQWLFSCLFLTFERGRGLERQTTATICHASHLQKKWAWQCRVRKLWSSGEVRKFPWELAPKNTNSEIQKCVCKTSQYFIFALPSILGYRRPRFSIFAFCLFWHEINLFLFLISVLNL